MPFTRAADLSNAVVTKFERDYLRQQTRKALWSRWVNWEAVHEGSGGSSYDMLTFGELDPVEDPLAEDSDIIPVQMRDGNLTVTPQEYGNSVAPTRVARWNARVMLRQAIAEQIGSNKAWSVDRLIRAGVLGGSNVRYPGIIGARTSLDATNDLITTTFLSQLWSDAIAGGLEPFNTGGFVIPIHSLLAADIGRLTDYKEVQYRRTGDGLDEIFGTGMAFTFMGFHFIIDRAAKLYLSGGTTGQAATTLSAGAARGATTISLTADTGIAVGDYLTIGALESRLSEQVQVTAGSSSPYTIRGGGSHPNNSGLRYPHAALEAVTEAANVAAMPVIGKNSIQGRYGDEWGKEGRVFVKQGLDQADRFVYHGWVWFGGLSVWDQLIIRGEVAVTGGIRGVN